MGASVRLALLALLAAAVVGCSADGGGVIKPEPSTKSPMEQRAEKGGSQTGK